MADTEIVCPMGMTDRDLSSRPLVFHPRGCLVAILADAQEAPRAATALGAAGFAERELRIHTSEQILADHGLYTGQRSTARRVVGALTGDQETIHLYFAHARDGRAALRVTSPTTTRPTAPSAASQAPPRSTSATSAIAARATSTSGDPPPDRHNDNRRFR